MTFATEKQLKYMDQLGILPTNFRDLTVQEAKAMIQAKLDGTTPERGPSKSSSSSFNSLDARREASIQVQVALKMAYEGYLSGKITHEDVPKEADWLFTILKTLTNRKDA